MRCDEISQKEKVIDKPGWYQAEDGVYLADWWKTASGQIPLDSWQAEELGVKSVVFEVCQT